MQKIKSCPMALGGNAPVEDDFAQSAQKVFYRFIRKLNIQKSMWNRGAKVAHRTVVLRWNSA